VEGSGPEAKAIAVFYGPSDNCFRGKSFVQKRKKSGLKYHPYMGEFKGKIEILITRNLLCQKFASLCRKIAIFCLFYF